MTQIDVRDPVTESVRILVVDDDEDGREMIADVLRHAGYSVCTACNGQEGLAALRDVRPDVILLDVNMPVMDGPHFRQAQRQDAGLMSIPVVVMTADTTVNPVLDMGVEKTVRKPFGARELLSIVAEFARRA